ncbi:hypothetical protein KKA50_03315 [Patescibacteria group bacterium]|nr:hypothetical protein [Patescibacteria group bacterium]
MKTLTEKAIQQDIKELQKRLEQIHPNPYKYITKKKFTALLESNPVNASNIKDLGLALMTCLAVLNDGHTYLGLSDDVLGTENFMFKFEYLNNGYYLTQSSECLSNYLGSKLLGINNYNIDELELIVKPFIPQENEISTRYYFSSKIVEPSILEYLGIRKTGNLKLQLEKGRDQIFVNIHPQDYNQKMLTLKGMMKQVPVTLQEKGIYWFTELPQIRAFYIQYNSCVERENLKISQIVNLFEKSQFKNIIIDFRNNKGGDSDVLKPLIGFLRKSEGKYKIVILTSADTYSSAIINVLELSSIKNAISVGEIPHSNPTHYGENQSFVLPNSKLKVFSSSKIFRFKGYKLGDSFKPTYIVDTQIQDLLNGKDTQIEYLSRLL